MSRPRRPRLPRVARSRVPRGTAAVVALLPLCAAGAGLSVASAPATGAAAAASWVQLTPSVHRLALTTSSPPTLAQCEASMHIACYQPSEVRAAYDLGPLAAKGIEGKGETIVIVDSFGSPTIAHDLGVFDAAFGLPAPPSLAVLQPSGPVPPYRPGSNRAGWAGETTLDVEWSHAMAPEAKILLVETPTSENEGTSGFPYIEKAVKYVVDHHLGGVISQSFSATEGSFTTAQSLLDLRGGYIDAAKKGVTVLTAAGDSGAADVKYNEVTYFLHPVTSWPDSDPLVTGIGGTQLHLNAAGDHTAPDSVWNDTYNPDVVGPVPVPFAGGSGLSIIFDRPAFQNGEKSIVGAQRGVPDISMSAACNGAVDTYQSFGGEPVGWSPACGTSEATPLFAGIVALADQVAGHPLGDINPALYSLSAAGAKGVVDVTKGNSTVSFTQGGSQHTVTGTAAGPGYDLASGVGTVDGAKFVPELAAAAG